MPFSWCCFEMVMPGTSHWGRHWNTEQRQIILPYETREEKYIYLTSWRKLRWLLFCKASEIHKNSEHDLGSWNQNEAGKVNQIYRAIIALSPTSIQNIIHKLEQAAPQLASVILHAFQQWRLDNRVTRNSLHVESTGEKSIHQKYLRETGMTNIWINGK